MNLNELLEKGIKYYENTGVLPSTAWMFTMSKIHKIKLVEIERFFVNLAKKNGDEGYQL